MSDLSPASQAKKPKVAAAAPTEGAAPAAEKPKVLLSSYSSSRAPWHLDRILSAVSCTI